MSQTNRYTLLSEPDGPNDWGRTAPGSLSGVDELVNRALPRPLGEDADAVCMAAGVAPSAAQLSLLEAA